jgi:hypothetical protein
VCAHCGCGEAANRHGDKRSILVSEVRQAMKTHAHIEGGKGINATAREINRMLRGRRRRK